VNAGTADATNLVYRFRTRRVESRIARKRSEPVYRTVVDYGPKRWLEWTTIEAEGTYAMEGSVLDRASGESAWEVVLVEVSRLASDSAVVTPTAHPLIFIYSAPPCRSTSTSPECLSRRSTGLGKSRRSEVNQLQAER
jgi:hypothetical protein